MIQAPLLSTRGIVKRFGGVTALKGVSFDLLPGEIHALCGENGAGKSTLIKLLSGFHHDGSFEGELLVGGEPAHFYGVADAERQGISVIYQELALVPEMTAAENLFLGAEPTRHGLIDWDLVYREAERLLERFGVRVDPRSQTRHLGVGERQLVEIVKALRKQSRILILDEPTAALAEAEVDVLLKILRELRAHGISCIYISHKLDEVFAVADRITVLRDGATVRTLKARDTDKAEVIRHMVGREIRDLFPRRRSNVGQTLLKVEGLRVAPTAADDEFLRGISFEARQGEVVGVGGLMGAGRTELLMSIFGAWGERRGGRVLVGGRPLSGGPRQAIQAGLAMVTEDRRRYGLFSQRSVGFNLSLSFLGRLSRRGLIEPERELKENEAWTASLKVKAPDADFPVLGLSGGNQQKVVIGRSLMPGPSVVFFDEPTRGIDVGAKLEVYEIVNRLTDEGKAVVLVSSELPELMGMSDRILILHEGALAGEFSREQATAERLMAAATGQALAA